MTTFVVTYPVQGDATFDADYYVATHMPLVRDKWSPYGLTSATALLPDQSEPPYAAVAVLEFADGASLDAALGSAEAADVFGDVPNFTAITPVGVRCEAR